MNAPGHSAEAERLLKVVSKDFGDPSNGFKYYDGDEDTAAMIAAAQVHATLALALWQQDAAVSLDRFVDSTQGDYPPVIQMVQR